MWGIKMFCPTAYPQDLLGAGAGVDVRFVAVEGEERGDGHHLGRPGRGHGLGLNFRVHVSGLANN